MDAENELRAAAAALLARVDSITSDEFQRGGERPQREHLRAVLRGGEKPWDVALLEREYELPWDVLLLERLYALPEEPRVHLLQALDMMLRYFDC